MNKNLLDKNSILNLISRHGKTQGFINEGRNAIRRSPDDKIGASLAFNINQFADGTYGSFEKRRRICGR